jgi:uncharacterized protein YjbI with pentapeptide repeats
LSNRFRPSPLNFFRADRQSGSFTWNKARADFALHRGGCFLCIWPVISRGEFFFGRRAEDRMKLLISCCIAAFSVLFIATSRADIFQWEYINPAAPWEGKQASATPTPGGAGVSAVPGANLDARDLNTAYLDGADLQNSSLVGSSLLNATAYRSDFTGASLRQANLTRGYFLSAILTGADFTDAEIRRAEIGKESEGNGTGITLQQLYSTASYKAMDLSGIQLINNDLMGGNFVGQNLTGSNIVGDMRGTDFGNANLTQASLAGAMLAGASFNGAEVRGAIFADVVPRGGITLAQLYSTASYQAHDLSGIRLLINLSGANLASQKLTDASFYSATLTNADLREADLTGADISSTALTGANFTNANLTNVKAHFVTGNPNFTQAELQGADFFYATLTSPVFSDANLKNAKFWNATLPGAMFNQATLVNADFYQAKLNGADFTGANLSHANFYSVYEQTDLSNAVFRQANLSNANFHSATLAGADFTGADVRGASFYRNLPNSGIQLSQLYSTASYQAHDLTGIDLSYNELAGADFSGQTLVNVNFLSANLSGANFAGADVRGARFDTWSSGVGTGITLDQLYSTASYQAQNLSGIRLNLNNLAGANFAGQNLASATFAGADLSGANFSQANLRDADLFGALLASAVFTGADVRGARFGESGPITLAQLYSTASYQMHDLSGIVLDSHNLAGGNFAGQNLTNANFQLANLTGADFTGAVVQGASFFRSGPGTGITLSQLYSTASYAAHNLSRMRLTNSDFTGANFAGQDLTGTELAGATLAGADFTGATVREASFAKYYQEAGTGLTLAQLYSTASYQAHDLSGIHLSDNDLAGGDFANQNLTGASFIGADLAGASLRQANLTGANFSRTGMTNADFTGANIRSANFSIGFGEDGIALAQLYSTASYQEQDLRGINLSNHNLAGVNFAGQNLSNADLNGAVLTGADLTGADLRSPFSWSPDATSVTTNLIWHDSSVRSVELASGQSLAIRDYDPIPHFPAESTNPITVLNEFAVEAGGLLKIVLEADQWDSTISFIQGIPVALAGTLELNFAGGVDVAGQVGRTFNLFDWSGVDPYGEFTVASPYAWDLSKLYTTGEVTLSAITALAGDFNGDGSVDAADYVVWRKGLGTTYTQEHFELWRTNFGASRSAGSGSAIPSAGPRPAEVPEPLALTLLVFGATALVLFRRR